MRISLDEAARAARQYRPSIEKGGQISISFDDKYSKKAGGSAGTAFAVAIISLMESFDLDPTFAITGDITVDGKMRKIGGVAQKITGGSKDGCKIIGLPAENVADVDDLPLLYPIETLQKVQVFSLTTLDDAVQLARAERTGKVQEAIKRFSDLQARWDNPSAPLSWRAPESQQELEAILALQPNHQSARILLATARGRSKRTLSMNTALDEMFAAATSLLQFYERPSQRSSEIYYMHLSKEEYKYARNRMNELEPMMPKEVSDLFYALRNLNDAIEYCDNELGQVPLWVTLPRYRQLVSKSISRVAVDDLEQRAKTMRDQMIKFNLDPAIRERLLHD
jgi:hypothetical protein